MESVTDCPLDTGLGSSARVDTFELARRFPSGRRIPFARIVSKSDTSIAKNDGILEIHSLDVISYIRGYFFTYICVEFWKEYIFLRQ